MSYNFFLKRFLDAYTTALKNQQFKLVYIDAFAGMGWIELRSNAGSDGPQRFLEGSALRALKFDDKPFDAHVFVEKDLDRTKELRKLREQHSNRKVIIENAEANEFLSKYS